MILTVGWDVRRKIGNRINHKWPWFFHPCLMETWYYRLFVSSLRNQTSRAPNPAAIINMAVCLCVIIPLYSWAIRHKCNRRWATERERYTNKDAWSLRWGKEQKCGPWDGGKNTIQTHFWREPFGLTTPYTQSNPFDIKKKNKSAELRLVA